MTLSRPTSSISKSYNPELHDLEQKPSFEERKRPENRPQHRQTGCDPKRLIGIHFGEEGKVGWTLLVPANPQKLFFL